MNSSAFSSFRNALRGTLSSFRRSSSRYNYPYAARVGIAATIVAVSGVGIATLLSKDADSGPFQVYADSKVQSIQRPSLTKWIPPTRESLLSDLKKTEVYDLLVIGGGATGVGCALEAASRGLKVALVEREDFASGTSSKSTKFVHGGVRYLEKAVMGLDWEQYKLVREALSERSTFLKIAPHLSHSMPILLPIYKWYLVPYFWAGSKAYDLIAGTQGVSTSYFMSRTKAIEAFPLIKQEGLAGAMVYYDGMHNDSRTNVSIALTAIAMGATAVNHVEVTSLTKNPESGKISGAIVRDSISGESFPIKAKGVINATGPYCDSIRMMDEPNIKAMVSPSSGVHIVLPSHYSPSKMGLLDPATSDGRVVFVLPWQGSVVAGTTDEPSNLSYDPIPAEKDIQFILNEVSHFLNPSVKIPREDVLAAWCGIRPLIKDPNSTTTQSLVRSHLVSESLSGLMTISGGKWTTFRNMAEETIIEAIKSFNTFSRATTALDLIHKYKLDGETADHLVQNYGDRAYMIVELDAKGTSDAAKGKRLPDYSRIVPDYPFLEAEIRYAARHEYAQTAVDILARRTRLAFLNSKAALESLPKIVSIMAAEAGWSTDRQAKETANAIKFLKSMGLQDQ
ncbi:hypothetical protein DI09_125p30 [Mitosporidium daphniae]|uniref:glycerol-3-phosphate dehydrogenase n=1 Tax=Mitosporidium daphniae TaxID=1485682 RepID=A0A098VV07_9MICR|nr:uncharacterized protein DI09_125p30 [Mitosporidium daphniae]KGG52913.1 hypothetical protein DI09_125p30 [Mitosporidium daphniae]|eukprot:XP_013239349.1 uncharacterized protein DI09_125p30 [Mitosporidium daphniae]